MQDNRFHISGQYVDQSWQRMRQLLDNELPVKKKRPLWILFIGLFVIIAFLAYFGWQHGADQQSGLDEIAVNAKESDRSLTQDEGEISSIQQETGDKQGMAGMDESKNLRDDLVVGAKSKEVVSQNRGQSADNNNMISNRMDKARQNVERINIEHQEEKSIAGADPVIENEIANFERMGDKLLLSDRSDAKIDVPIEARQLYAFDQLPLVPFQLFEISYLSQFGYPAYFEAGKIEPLKREDEFSVFGLGVYSSVLADGFTRVGGMDAGLFVSANIHKSWRVNALFGYHQFRYDSKNDQFDLSAVNAEEMDTNAMGGQSITLSYDSANRILNKTKYLHSQLELAYEGIPGLWLTAGARVSRLLSARNEEISVESPVFLMGQLNLRPTYLKENELLDKWSVGLVFGIECSVQRRISLTGQYHYGLDAIISPNSFDISTATGNADGQRYQRFLRLGLNINLF